MTTKGFPGARRNLQELEQVSLQFVGSWAAFVAGVNDCRGTLSDQITIACDVGGTFTDLIVHEGHGLELFETASTPADPIAGVISALERAASANGATNISECVARCRIFIHATMQATNAFLTRGGARTAFLTTEGHRDILLLREGGRLNPYDNRQEFPRPYIPRALTFEIPERIGASGEIVRPLDQSTLAGVIDLLALQELEAVGVCFLWSVANPVHELRVGETIAKRLPKVSITLSHGSTQSSGNTVGRRRRASTPR